MILWYIFLSIIVNKLCEIFVIDYCWLWNSINQTNEMKILKNAVILSPYNKPRILLGVRITLNKLSRNQSRKIYRSFLNPPIPPVNISKVQWYFLNIIGPKDQWCVNDQFGTLTSLRVWFLNVVVKLTKCLNLHI